MSRSQKAEDDRKRAELRKQFDRENGVNQQSQAAMSQEEQLKSMVTNAVIGELAKDEARMDAELARLDRLAEMGDAELEQLHERRRLGMMQKAKKEAEWRAQGHGSYFEVAGQKDFFAEVKGSERVLCHFYRPSTERCLIVDKHLSTIAVRHPETKIIKINVEKSPFLVERLHIWSLPSIVICIGGKTQHTIVGFDEFGGDDDFSTEVVEYVLGKHGAIFHDGQLPQDDIEKHSVTFVAKTQAASKKLDDDDDWWD